MKDDAKIASELDFFEKNLAKGNIHNAVQHFLAARALCEEESPSETVQHLVRESTTTMNQHPSCSDMIVARIGEYSTEFLAINNLEDIANAEDLLLKIISAFKSLGQSKQHSTKMYQHIDAMKKHIDQYASHWISQLASDKSEITSKAATQIQKIISAAESAFKIKIKITNVKHDAEIASELNLFERNLDEGDIHNAVQHFLAARALCEEESPSEETQHQVRLSTTRMNQHASCSDMIVAKIKEYSTEFLAISNLEDIANAEDLLLKIISAFKSLGQSKQHSKEMLQHIDAMKKHIDQNASHWISQFDFDENEITSKAATQFGHIEKIISAAESAFGRKIEINQEKMDALEMARTIHNIMKDDYTEDSVERAFYNMVMALRKNKDIDRKEKEGLIKMAYQLVKPKDSDRIIQMATLQAFKQKAINFERSPSLKEKNIARLMSIFMAVLRIFTNKKDEYRFFPPKKVDTPVSQSMKTLEHKLEDRSKQAKKS